MEIKSINMERFGILGIKKGMTQIPEGEKLIGVTIIDASNNVISQVKTLEKDGYEACQIAFFECSKKSLNKAKIGHLAKNNIAERRHLREIRGMKGYSTSDSLAIEKLEGEKKVKITGTSKGKGTAGVIKRYGFKIGNMSHGAGYPHRLIGSMGGGRGTNQGVPKGKKMPGRMGDEKKTKIVKIVKIDKERSLIFVKGSIPGAKKSLVIIKTIS